MTTTTQSLNTEFHYNVYGQHALPEKCKNAYREFMKVRASVLNKDAEKTQGIVNDFFAREDSAYVACYDKEENIVGMVTFFPRDDYVYVAELQVNDRSQYLQIGESFIRTIATLHGKNLYCTANKSNEQALAAVKVAGGVVGKEFHPEEHPDHKAEDGWLGITFSVNS